MSNLIHRMNLSKIHKTLISSLHRKDKFFFFTLITLGWATESIQARFNLSKSMITWSNSKLNLKLYRFVCGKFRK